MTLIDFGAWKTAGTKTFSFRFPSKKKKFQVETARSWAFNWLVSSTALRFYEGIKYGFNPRLIFIYIDVDSSTWKTLKAFGKISNSTSDWREKYFNPNHNPDCETLSGH